MREDEQGFPPCIIVIDALDECKEEATSTILSALSMFASRLTPLRFFITSRPVTRVVRGFRGTSLMETTNALVMHNIPLSISQKDIHVYLEGRLSRIARFFGLKSWPSNKELDKLVELSSGLFIYASTVVNFVDDQNAGDPIQQLSTMLSTPYIASIATSPHRHLDALYLKVLREAFPDVSKDQQMRLRMVLGTNVLLFDPLDPEKLEVLLALRANTVRMTLQYLHSIV